MNQKAYLDAMGIDVWVPREHGAGEQGARDQGERQASPVVEMDVETPVVTSVDNPQPVISDDISQMDWSALESKVSQCSLCELHTGRIHTVFGVGNPQAELLVIGEAPGAEEDQQGQPFVGQAGELLTAMLKAIQLSRREVYIANILKCHPPKNRAPKQEEVLICSQYLLRQIELIQPKLVLVAGRIAAQSLLQTDLDLDKMRGQIHQYPQTEIPLIVTFHPAHLLLTPSDKRKAWQDLIFVQQTLGDRAGTG